MSYFVYVLLCLDGSFYTGYTKNLQERMQLHVTGRGARYTKSHPPKEVAHVETFTTRSEAMQRERTIKKLSHHQKEQLIAINKMPKRTKVGARKTDKPAAP
jgi:putative endonuclease